MDAGYMTSREARHVRAVNRDLPKSFLSPEKVPQTKILELETPEGPRRVGLVFFPERTSSVESQKKQEHAVLTAGKELMGQTSLVLGVSLWGEERDFSFLPLAAGAFDLILSSGYGSIYELKTRPDAPGIAILRPVDKGIAIPYLDFFEWPAHVDRENAALHVQLNIEPLGDDVPEDQDIAGLAGRIPGGVENAGHSPKNAADGELSIFQMEEPFSPDKPVSNCQ